MSEDLKNNNIIGLPGFPKLDFLQKRDKSSLMKKIVLQMIATQVNPKDVADLQKLFQSIDVDGNGSLTLKELQCAFQKLEGGPDLILEIMEADLDHSGEISYS